MEYNDIFRENLDPWNVWVDDMARPNDPWSVRDWCWRKVYSYDSAKEEFGNYPNFKFVQPKAFSETATKRGEPVKRHAEKNLCEVYFYENKIKDVFYVLINDIPVVIVPLPIEDARGNKKLSLWQTYWTLRHAESIYGIGIYEAIRYEHALLDRFRNMTIDQLTLSINKMFFYQGTQNLTDTGEITIKPGVGKQILNPKDIQWMEVPGPGREAFEGIKMLRSDAQEASGITDTLIGEVTGKTAFEIAQAKEAALKRLKTPLDNVLDALQQDGYITIALLQLIYSIPEVRAVTDPDLIHQYLEEIRGDPELYKSSEEGFQALIYPEFPLNLDQGGDGKLIEAEQTQFFRVKPQFLSWEGIINIKPQSILSPSKQVDKALELEMWNILIPLLIQPAEIYVKAAKSIVKLYEKDPKEILPDAWLQIAEQPEESLIVPAEQGGAVPPSGSPEPQVQSFERPQVEAEKFTTSPLIPQEPRGIARRLVSRLSAPFRSA